MTFTTRIKSLNLSTETNRKTFNEKFVSLSDTIIYLTISNCAIQMEKQKEISKENYSQYSKKDLFEALESSRETARKEIKSLNKTKLFLESILDNSPTAIIICEAPNGNISYINDAVWDFRGKTDQRMTGITVEEYIGTWKEFFPDGRQYKGEEMPLARSLLTSEVVKNEQLIVKLDDGTTKWAAAWSAPIYDKEKNIIAAIVLFYDVTEQKKLELQLKRAKENAEAANLAKSNFLANMSHEIRTPMNAIMGYTDIMLQQNPPEKFREYLNIIKYSSNNLLTIINDVLDFSKIEDGKIAIENVSFNLHQLLENVVSSMQILAEEKYLLLKLESLDTIPRFINGDPTRLNQILVNLIGNAIKFTKEGEVVIAVKNKVIKSENCLLTFSIKDTGIGISKENQIKIFEKFIQADNSTTREYGGTGLGLTISKRLIELMGGEISVKSELNKGSEFIFQLKYGISTEDKIDQDTDKRIQVVDIENIHILLADDNKINRLMAVESFKTYNPNIDIDVVNDGLEVIKALTHKKYDVILMDLQMPRLNGFDATRHIRTVLKDNIKIIALTASILPSRLNECIKAGMDDFVLKPFSIYKLVSKIAYHLNLRVVESNEEKIQDNRNEKRKTLINLERVINFSGNIESVRESLEILLTEIPEELGDLDKHVQNKDWQNVVKDTHSLVNKSFYTGVETFTYLLKEIEEIARHNIENNNLPLSLTEIFSLWEKVKTELEEYLDNLK